jgi:adenylosuccinate synthase
MTFDLGKLKTEDISFYVAMGKKDFEFDKEYYNMSSSEVENIFSNTTDYGRAIIPISIKNSSFINIYISSCKIIGKLPQGLWLDTDYAEYYPCVIKGDSTVGQIQFLFNKKLINQKEIKKLIEAGNVGISIMFKHTEIKITIPINQKTSKFLL